MPDNITQIPPPRVAIWDTVTDYVTRGWYRFFYNLYAILGSGSLRNGAFYDTTDQAATAINTGKLITINTTRLSQGVSLGTPSSRIYVDRTGTYNFQLTLNVGNYSLANGYIYLGVAINGTAQTDFGSVCNIPQGRFIIVAPANFVLRLSAGDYVEFGWATDNIDVRLSPLPATSYVARIPSVNVAVFCNIGE
jgi:hypothetical protein